MSSSTDRVSGPQIEFDADQNAVFRTLGRKMRFVGMFAIVLGVLALLGGVFGMMQLRDSRDFSLACFGIMQLLIGAWTRAAGAEFQRVAETHGADISHLMNALVDLRKLYTFQYWLAILMIVLVVITVVLAVTRVWDLVRLA